MSVTDDDHETMQTRRVFLAGLAAAAATPLLARCGSEKPAAGTPVGSDGSGTRHARPPLPAAEPVMRVRVLRADGPGAQAMIGAATQWLSVETAADEGTETVLRGPVVVRAGRQRWSVVDANGEKAPLEAFEPFEITSLSADEPDLALGKRVYPGRFRLVGRAGDPEGFNVINLVPMEAYLPGVVAGELFAHWLPETRAAQAIAARSFAASEHDWFGDRRDWDVTATAHSQVYRGRVDHGQSVEAAESTRGVVLAYDERLVPGYYSSCCGGTAAVAIDAIGPNPANDVPPLAGRDGEDVCIDTKLARWTIDRPVEELTNRLAAWGRQRGRADLADLAEVASIDVLRRNEHGRPIRYTVAGAAGGKVELSAEHLRDAVNFAGGSLKAPAQRLWSSFVSVTVRNRSAVFTGRGFGHGVGLCQYGAEILARDGKDHEAILKWYYPDVDVVRSY